MPDFGFVLLCHSLSKTFNLKNSIVFFSVIRSKGEAKAMFLRHEGFLGALGAFMSYEKHGLDDLKVHHLTQKFPMSSLVGDKICSPLNGELNDNESIECSVYAS